MERRIDNESGHWRPNNWLFDSIRCPIASRVRRGRSQFSPILDFSRESSRLVDSAKEKWCVCSFVCISQNSLSRSQLLVRFLLCRPRDSWLHSMTYNLCSSGQDGEKKATLKLLPLIAVLGTYRRTNLSHSHCVDFCLVSENFDENVSRRMRHAEDCNEKSREKSGSEGPMRTERETLSSIVRHNMFCFNIWEILW